MRTPSGNWWLGVTYTMRAAGRSGVTTGPSSSTFRGSTVCPASRNTCRAAWYPGCSNSTVEAGGRLTLIETAIWQQGKRGEDPQFVYTVRFDAAELWGPDAAEPNSSVYFDAWEPYLQAA